MSARNWVSLLLVVLELARWLVRHIEKKKIIQMHDRMRLDNAMRSLNARTERAIAAGDAAADAHARGMFSSADPLDRANRGSSGGGDST